MNGATRSRAFTEMYTDLGHVLVNLTWRCIALFSAGQVTSGWFKVVFGKRVRIQKMAPLMEVHHRFARKLVLMKLSVSIIGKSIIYPWLLLLNLDICIFIKDF